MKLRILDQSVRFRLRRSEVERLGREGSLAATIRMAARDFEYRLDSTALVQPELHWNGKTLCLRIPADILERWTNSEDVAWYTEIDGVSVSVEKDFQRTHVKGELDFDLYPNPRRAGA